MSKTKKKSPVPDWADEAVPEDDEDYVDKDTRRRRDAQEACRELGLDDFGDQGESYED